MRYDPLEQTRNRDRVPIYYGTDTCKQLAILVDDDQNLHGYGNYGPGHIEKLLKHSVERHIIVMSSWSGLPRLG